MDVDEIHPLGGRFSTTNPGSNPRKKGASAPFLVQHWPMASAWFEWAATSLRDGQNPFFSWQTPQCR
jgi:hypothetical protein